MNYKIIYSFTIIILFHSCKKCNDNDAPTPLGAYELTFSILDANTLEDAIPIKYNPDSLKVYSAELINLNIKYTINNYLTKVDSIHLFYPIYFIDPKIDANSYEKEINKYFFIYLNSIDIDTLQVGFKVIKHKCYYEIDYVKVRHNNMEILTEDFGSTFYFTIKK